MRTDRTDPPITAFMLVKTTPSDGSAGFWPGASLVVESDRARADRPIAVRLKDQAGRGGSTSSMPIATTPRASRSGG
ncbi:hypothetical protein LV75_003538 [Actinokineospora diospyrosa]|uniref:Uncharacterized protein n=1 Tax=Actinokineospora diospyrosa TaxID=103728 RepID=A0ABT1IEP7_9PSEU|nr:hypothetical protein [Actinokineospora diospyrosa]